ncbi:MAG: hypothetical protein ACKVXR_09970 [Planctomycetota bacterium]
MTILLIVGVFLLAVWLVETIVFLVAYRRSSRPAPGLPGADSSWRSGRPQESLVVPSTGDRPGSTRTALLS